MTAAVRLSSPAARDRAKRMIDAAPDGHYVTVKAPTRSGEQNDLLWALLTRIARARPGGRVHTPEVWKSLLMSAHGYESHFEMGLDNKPFPVGFRSSHLTVPQMSELIEFVTAWGAQNGVDMGGA